MSILVGISLFMTLLSLLMFFAACYASSQSEQSFSPSIVVGVYAFLAFAVFWISALWFGLIEPRLAS